MGGIYGDLIGYFPELFITLELYSGTKVPGGLINWSSEPMGTVRAIIQQPKRTGELAKRADEHLRIQNGMLQVKAERVLWTHERIAVLHQPGEYVGVKFDGVIWLVAGDAEWNAEGGFYRYFMENIGGSLDANTGDSSVNTGTGHF